MYKSSNAPSMHTMVRDYIWDRVIQLAVNQYGKLWFKDVKTSEYILHTYIKKYTRSGVHT